MNTERIEKLEALAMEIELPLDFIEEAMNEGYDVKEIIEVVDSSYTKEELTTDIINSINNFLTTKNNSYDNKN